MSETGHESHADTSPLGLLDVVAAAIIFSGLSWVAIRLAGPDGFGFLKGLLNETRSYEFVLSGFLFIGVWYFLGAIVLNPYLQSFFEREEKTRGTLERAAQLKKSIEQAQIELSAELMTARMDGVRKRDQRVLEAKANAQEIIAEGRRKAESEWNLESQRLGLERENLLAAAEGEVSKLSELVYDKVLGGSSVH
ncbi:MAG TPA: ATP synthase F0 subunit B [Oligoflexia bacterium]|nr:ATP synthase F0 subunit B [Oligoflexia bacterium]HMP48160.1 ATP synthase F0 subunit B [Oligoflexia bacterium]